MSTDASSDGHRLGGRPTVVVGGQRSGTACPPSCGVGLDRHGNRRHGAEGPGIDLIAVRDDRWLAVEVKGFPSTTYEHGDRRGQPKPTQPTNQARQWFSHALLGMMLMRDKRPDAEIAIALPDYETYRRLADRTSVSFSLLGFGVYLISASGSVSLRIPHAPAYGGAARSPDGAP